jgi:hypothetical protein
LAARPAPCRFRCALDTSCECRATCHQRRVPRQAGQAGAPAVPGCL